MTAVGGGQGEDVDWPVTWTQEIRGSSPLPPSWHVNSAYCSHSGSCSKDITLREWGGPEAIWMVQWWNPIKASVQTFKVLTDGHGDVFIKGPSKTTLVSKCSCGLNPPPTTPTTWSDLPLSSIFPRLSVYGGQFQISPRNYHSCEPTVVKIQSYWNSHVVVGIKTWNHLSGKQFSYFPKSYVCTYPMIQQCH